MTKSQLRCQIYVSQVSGGEGQALPPPLFLDQTEARRAENKFWRPLPTRPPPPPPLSEGLNPPLQALYQELQRTKN